MELISNPHEAINLACHPFPPPISRILLCAGKKRRISFTSASLMQSLFLIAFNVIQKKYGRRIEKPEETFTINIGEVDIIFNMSNV